MQHVRRLVEGAADAVAAEIAHHRAALRLRKGLDGMADIADAPAGADRGDAAHQALVGDLDQPLGGALQLADRVHAAGIAMPAIDDEGHVDVDDVALAQRLLVGNAVADDVVDGGAARLAVAAIVEGGGHRAVIEPEGEDEIVDRLGGHARPHNVVERSRHAAASRPALRMPSKPSGP